MKRWKEEKSKGWVINVNHCLRFCWIDAWLYATTKESINQIGLRSISMIIRIIEIHANSFRIVASCFWRFVRTTCITYTSSIESHIRISIDLRWSVFKSAKGEMKNSNTCLYIIFCSYYCWRWFHLFHSQYINSIHIHRIEFLLNRKLNKNSFTLINIQLYWYIITNPYNNKKTLSLLSNVAIVSYHLLSLTNYTIIDINPLYAIKTLSIKCESLADGNNIERTVYHNIVYKTYKWNCLDYFLWEIKERVESLSLSALMRTKNEIIFYDHPKTVGLAIWNEVERKKKKNLTKYQTKTMKTHFKIYTYVWWHRVDLVEWSRDKQPIHQA